MNPIKAIKTEISDTITHLKELYIIAKKEGVAKALTADALCTAMRHPEMAEYLGLIKVKPKNDYIILPAMATGESLNTVTGEKYRSSMVKPAIYAISIENRTLNPDSTISDCCDIDQEIRGNEETY